MEVRSESCRMEAMRGGAQSLARNPLSWLSTVTHLVHPTSQHSATWRESCRMEAMRGGAKSLARNPLSWLSTVSCIVHPTSQHSTTWRSDQKLVLMEAMRGGA